MAKNANEYMKGHILNCGAGLTAQLVEHYPGIVEMMGSNPVQA